MKTMDRESFDKWNAEFEDTKLNWAGEEKEEKQAKLALEIEHSFFLLGASALEDKL